jgi:hypothetical protein
MSPADYPGLADLGPQATIEDGLILTMKWATPARRTAAGYEQRERELYALDLVNGRAQQLPVRYQALFYWLEFRPPQIPFVDLPVPFAPGREFGAGHGLVVAGETASFRLHAYGADGRKHWEVALEHEPRLPSGEERAWAERSLEARLSDPLFREVVRRAVRSMGGEYTVPMVGRRAWERLRASKPDVRPILVDPDRNVWVLGYVANDAVPRSWLLFSGEGRWLGRMTLPHGFLPLEVGRDYVLGWREEESGAIVVVLYQLTKT